MKPSRAHERGEGKIGCIVTLLILATFCAAAVKVVPVLYSNNSLASEAEDLGSRAGLIGLEAVDKQLRAKALDLEIHEALPKGAMTVTALGERSAGTCIIKLHYTRKIDFFGLYTMPIDTDKTVSRPYMDAR